MPKTVNSNGKFSLIMAVGVSVFFGFSLPAFGNQSRDMLNQALVLVQQALDQGGGALSNDQRKDLLTKARQLLLKAPPANFHGYKTFAMREIGTALDEITNGDPDNAAQ